MASMVVPDTLCKQNDPLSATFSVSCTLPSEATSICDDSLNESENQSRLRSWVVSLSLPEIDPHLQHPTHLGTNEGKSAHPCGGLNKVLCGDLSSQELSREGPEARR